MKQQHNNIKYGLNKNIGSGNELFLVSSGKVIVTDPCYDKDIWCNEVLENVAKGWWNANVVQAKIGKMGHRICEIEAELVERYPSSTAGKDSAIIHEQKIIGNIQDSEDWEEISTSIGVDSGQAGFFDIEYFKDEDIVTKELKEEIKQLGFIESNDQWYGMSCIKTLSTARWGIIPFGAVASSGYGDGSYKLYIKRFLDEIIAMKIVFIPVKIIEVEDETR